MKDKKKQKISIRLLWVIGIVCVMLGAYPFIRTWVQYAVVAPKEVPTVGNLLSFSTTTEVRGESLGTTTAAYRIIIPSIGVDMPVVVGDSLSEAAALAQGAWRLPRTSNPTKSGGNTVIAGHRFLETSGPNTFFHLDKVQIGDSIILVWNDEVFQYTVTEQMVVPPTAVDILLPTDVPTLTLFTCTPVFTTQNRLVLRAVLKEECEENGCG